MGRIQLPRDRSLAAACGPAGAPALGTGTPLAPSATGSAVVGMRPAAAPAWPSGTLVSAAARAVVGTRIPALSAWTLGARIPGRGRGRCGLRVIEPFGLFADNAAADEAFERTQGSVVLGRHKTEGVANGLGAAGPANPVDVVLGVWREIVVDHMRNAVHIDAAGGNVGGDQNPDFAGLEFLQSAQPLVLGAVGVERCVWDLAGRQPF